MKRTLGIALALTAALFAREEAAERVVCFLPFDKLRDQN